MIKYLLGLSLLLTGCTQEKSNEISNWHYTVVHRHPEYGLETYKCQSYGLQGGAVILLLADGRRITILGDITIEENTLNPVSENKLNPLRN